MSLNNIKTKLQQERGFTIVELLIVVVVIAILAAITIVSYNGITTRANGAAAQGAASTLQKKVETYAADSSVGNYATTLSALTAPGNSWTTPVVWSTTPSVNAAPTASTSASIVQYQVCGRASSGTSPVAAPGSLAAVVAGVVTGARVGYWDYTASTPAVAYVNSGVVTGQQVTVNSVVYNVACYPPTS